ncbi:DUF7537 family lipoprotein [Halosimplex salinum]|uniref:DUF7537 family lipoprotein n=1 Tax=Halosimplex salinum TaxID=1710538 RepID=UPI001F35A408|nr:hypothetical protein [Halosimplex salinum]
MRASLLSTVAVVALLVLAGCSGLPVTGENEPTPDASPSDFPNASAINHTVFDTHAAAMGNASFNLTTEMVQKDGAPWSDERNFTYWNDTTQYLAEPGDSQYILHRSGSYEAFNGTRYSNGSTVYALSPEGNVTVKPVFITSVLNESGENYLWRGGLLGDDHDSGAINATYERKGVEMFQGVPVMRYEANDTDALNGKWAPRENASWAYQNFSATLLLDGDGIVRHYQYTFVRTPELIDNVRYSRTYTLSDVGNTDVEKPDWAKNATTGS